MNKFSNFRQPFVKFTWTLLTVALLITVIFLMLSNTFSYSESECYEKLHLETKQIKKNINTQMLSDRENLITMSNFASNLYENGDSYGLLFESFEKIGLFEDIGILTPDGHFLTRFGKMDVSDAISFEEESARGQYVSGRVTDLVDKNREVVRSCVPVKDSADRTVAILYGVINLDVLEEKFADDAKDVGAELYVVEGGSGNYIIDTKHEKLGNITYLASSTFKDGYSYDDMIENLTLGQSGYTAFVTKNGGELFYSHYAPLEFSDWQIMLAQPEEVVFAGAIATSNYLVLMAAVIILIMIGYILLIVISERKTLKINATASKVRKALLEINQQFDKLYDALKTITRYAGARSTFVVDTYSDAYEYTVSSHKDKLITGVDRQYFISRILRYASAQRGNNGAAIYICEISPKTRLDRDDEEFGSFMRIHGIEKVCFAVVLNNTSNTSVLGVINPKNHLIVNLLREIAICFSMAIHNKKYLSRTEEMALTDALTGVKNRMAYKQDIRQLEAKPESGFACVYIDVNELHYFNAQYGHSAGDQMLSYIAEALKEEFPDGSIYRMGGDEFLVFSDGIGEDELREKLADANNRIEEMKYHISIGVERGDGVTDIEELVNKAEKLMYDEKARYYQGKEVHKISRLANRRMEAYFTGIKEIDAYISVISVHCLGVFCVSHKIDKSVQVLSPSYFSEMLEESHSFTEAMRHYIHDVVKPEYHRILFSFLDYATLEHQFADGTNPKVTYTKIDGENVTLSIYSNSEKHDDDIDSVWVFEKEEN